MERDAGVEWAALRAVFHSTIQSSEIESDIGCHLPEYTTVINVSQDYSYAPLAQRSERAPHKRLVLSSNPRGSTKSNAGCSIEEQPALLFS